MCDLRFNKIFFLMGMVLLNICLQGVFAAEKDADELEEALMVKLLEKRVKKRSGDDSDDDKVKRVEKVDIKFAKSDDKSEISITVVNDIKTIVKEPCLNFLASSELISWGELNSRLVNAKRALEMFEVKYKIQLTSAGAAPVQAVIPQSMPSALPQKMTFKPGVAVMPGVSLPKKSSDEDEEEEDDEDVKPAAPLSMPGIGMPGLKPATPLTGIVPPSVKIPTPSINSALPLVPVAPVKPAASSLSAFPSAPVLPAAPVKPAVPVIPVAQPKATPLAGGMPLAR